MAARSLLVIRVLLAISSPTSASSSTTLLTEGAASFTCNSNEDCNLLGECVDQIPQPRCVCDAGWTGDDCGTAHFKPANLTLGYNNPAAKTWGGNVLAHADGKKHSLYVSQFSHNCPLCLWYSNSRVVRAESTTGAAGPYSFEEVVFSGK